MPYFVSKEAENAATGEMVEKPQASKSHLAVLDQRVKEIGQILATLGRIWNRFMVTSFPLDSFHHTPPVVCKPTKRYGNGMRNLSVGESL